MLCDLRAFRCEFNDDDVPKSDKGIEEFENIYLAELNKQGNRVYTDDDGLRVHRIIDAMSTVTLVIKVQISCKNMFQCFCC